MSARPTGTLRGRVVRNAAIGMGAGLLVLIIAFNLILRSTLRSAIDSRLADRAAAVSTTVADENGRLSVREGTTGDASLDTGVWVFQGTREVEAPTGAPQLTGAARSVAAGPARGFTTSGGYRLHSRAVRAGGRTLGTIVVASSMATVERTERVALIASILLALLTLAAMVAVTWAAVGRALDPVAEMTSQADRWGERDLDQRFGAAERPAELQQLATTFDHLLDRIAASLRHERRLSAELSHELRTPLAAITAQAELLAARPHEGQAQQEAAQQLLRSSARMEAILETLMAAARAESGTAPGVCELGAAVRGATAHIEGTRDVRVDVQSPSPVRAGVQEDLVERMVDPVIANGLRFARREVRVRVGSRDGVATIDISDDGPGIPPDQLERVFEPGLSLEAGNGSHDGAGLGLALARRLARSVGGDLEALPAEGAHLRITLPAA